MSKVAVIIPAYKEKLDESELVSFKRIADVFKERDIFIVYPEGLPLKYYKEQAKMTLNELSFKKKYFNNIWGYNKLMLNKRFYQSFKNFDYILICQLDTYIFKDKLDYWTSLDYDYIGGPWKNVYVDQFVGYLSYGVGNGGLSLRKVNSFIKILSTFKTIYTFKQLFVRAKSNKSAGVKVYFEMFYFYLFNNRFNTILNGYDRNEDFFWGVKVPQKISWFKVPKWEIAVNFSIDLHPEFFSNYLTDVIPMGCHAWCKNYSNYWKDYIRC